MTKSLTPRILAAAVMAGCATAAWAIASAAIPRLRAIAARCGRRPQLASKGP